MVDYEGGGGNGFWTDDDNGVTSGATTTGPTTTGPAMQGCGPDAPPCSDDEFCDVPNGACGQLGVCMPRPDGCDDDCPGVCGCDGQKYCNECTANAVGTDVSGDDDCLVPDAAYSAELWVGGLDHIIVRKADYDADTCTKLFVDAPSGNQPSFDIKVSEPWGIVGAIRSNSASDCDGNRITNPSGSALGGSGWLELDGGPNGLPCKLALDVLLTFDSKFGNVAMKSDGMAIDGCET